MSPRIQSGFAVNKVIEWLTAVHVLITCHSALNTEHVETAANTSFLRQPLLNYQVHSFLLLHCHEIEKPFFSCLDCLFLNTPLLMSTSKLTAVSRIHDLASLAATEPSRREQTSPRNLLY